MANTPLRIIVLLLPTGFGLVATSSLAQATAGLEAATSPVTPQPLVMPSLTTPEVFELPKLDTIKRTAASYGTDRARFTLKTIIVSPTKLLTDKQIHAVTDGFLNRQITLADIASLRDDLTLLLVTKGYINSGAVIPDQDATNGTLKVQIVEGKLTRLDVKGVSYLSNTYLAQRLNVSQTQPLNATELQEAYQLLLEDKNISHLNARLVPGTEPGEATLEVDATEANRDSINAFVASDRSPSVGDTRFGIGGSHATFIKPGDIISGEVGKTRGLTDGQVNYSDPLTASGLELNLFLQGSKAQILDKPLNALDAISNSFYIGGSLTYPLIARPGQSLTLSTTLDQLRVGTELMGSPFSFSPGAVDGRTDYVTSRTTLSYSYFSNVRSYILTMTGAHGLGGSKGATGVDTNFTYVDFAGTYVQKLNNANHRLILKGSARMTNDVLYATEMFTIGGISTVRGYRQNALLGNKGYWGSAEYQVPLNSLVHTSIPANSMVSPQRLVLGAFVDTGHIDPTGPQYGPAPNKLTAMGLHALWSPTSHVSVDVYAAHQLQKAPFTGSYQDRGLGFALNVKY